MSFKFVLFTFIFVSVIVYTSTQSNDKENDYRIARKNRQKLILSESRRIFHKKPENYLPPLGIITLTELKNVSSDGNRIQLIANNTYNERVYKLNLTPVRNNVILDGIPTTKIWSLRSSPQKNPNYTYNIVDVGGSSINGQFYEDVEEMAVLLVNQKDGHNYYDGTIGEVLSKQAVRPIPESWNGTIFYATHEDHIVFKRSTRRNNVRLSEMPRKSIDILYPKLIIVVDYSLFETLGSISEVIQYVATYWNAVNLKFSLIQYPKVEIMITSIVIVTDETALNCIYQAQSITEEKRQKIKLSNDVLSLCSAYFNQQFYKDTGFNNFDATIIMTALKTKYMGLAYTGQICSRGHSLAYVHDEGDFLSVHTGTHEFAHLLGIIHDGPGGAENCSTKLKYVSENYKIGTVMTNPEPYAHKYIWSNCSIQSLQNFASKKAADCLEYQFRDNKFTF